MIWYKQMIHMKWKFLSDNKKAMTESADTGHKLYIYIYIYFFFLNIN